MSDPLPPPERDDPPPPEPCGPPPPCPRCGGPRPWLLTEFIADPRDFADLDLEWRKWLESHPRGRERLRGILRGWAWVVPPICDACGPTGGTLGWASCRLLAGPSDAGPHGRDLAKFRILMTTLFTLPPDRWRRPEEDVLDPFGWAWRWLLDGLVAKEYAVDEHAAREMPLTEVNAILEAEIEIRARSAAAGRVRLPFDIDPAPAVAAGPQAAQAAQAAPTTPAPADPPPGNRPRPDGGGSGGGGAGGGDPIINPVVIGEPEPDDRITPADLEKFRRERWSAPKEVKLVEMLAEETSVTFSELAESIHGGPDNPEGAIKANVTRTNNQLRRLEIPFRFHVSRGVVFKEAWTPASRKNRAVSQ